MPLTVACGLPSHPTAGVVARWYTAAVEDDDRAKIIRDLKPQAWPYPVHEAVHAVVAHRLGEYLVSAEIDPYLIRDAGVNMLPIADTIIDIAVTVAGCGAEHLVGSRTPRRAKGGDRKRLKDALSDLASEAQRAAALAAGYRFASEKLTAHRDDVRKIAPALMDRWSLAGPVRIERAEMITLLEPIDMERDWLRGLADWAGKNDNVNELWLFGSRAAGISEQDSDVDLGLGLAPPIGDHDWALGNFFVLSKRWRRELEAIVGRHVSLEPITPERPGSAIVRKWVLLWRRECA